MILVIGYGNSLRGDDGIGPYVVERLGGEKLGGDVALLAVRQLTPELAEPISWADTVIFIDCRAGEPPGQIECQSLSPSAHLGQSRSSAFTHTAHPVSLLDSAGALYGRCPTAYLYGVTGQDFGFGAGLSAAVEAAIPELLAMITDRIADCRKTALPVPS